MAAQPNIGKCSVLSHGNVLTMSVLLLSASLIPLSLAGSRQKTSKDFGMKCSGSAASWANGDFTKVCGDNYEIYTNNYFSCFVFTINLRTVYKKSKH